MAHSRRYRKTRQGVPARLGCALAAFLACSQAALALDPRLTLAQYNHTSWVQSEGALIPAIGALAQTADGYLWFGTWQGLWRFDGLRFARWMPPSGQPLDEVVTALAASRTGGLWIGTRHGLQSLENGRLTDYSGRSGLTAGYVAALWQSPNGGLWMGAVQSNVSGITVLDPQAVAALPNAEVHSLSVDTTGNLWAATRGGFYVCPTADREHHCYPKAIDLQPEMTAGGGQAGAALKNVRSLLYDRDGSLWLGTEGQGLYLVATWQGGAVYAPRRAVERFRRSPAGGPGRQHLGGHQQRAGSLPGTQGGPVVHRPRTLGRCGTRHLCSALG